MRLVQNKRARLLVHGAVRTAASKRSELSNWLQRPQRSQGPSEPGQYTSLLFCDRAYDEQVRLSFGRIGTAADNAAIEAFWSTLKRELRFLHRRRVWPDRALLRAALFDYLEIFSNRECHQARPAHRTPAEYEQEESAINV